MTNLRIEYTIVYEILGRSGPSFEHIAIFPDEEVQKVAKRLMKKHGGLLVNIKRTNVSEEQITDALKGKRE